jgi:hypothetical protein
MRYTSRATDFLRSHPLLLSACAGLVILAWYMLMPVQFVRRVPAPEGEGDRLYFGSTGVVAQEFHAHAGLSALSIPLGGTFSPATPLILHLRKDISGPDLASVPVFSVQGEQAVFHLSKGLPRQERPLVWILEAPHSPARFFWVYREQEEGAFKEGNAYYNGRVIRGNLGFTETWAIPRLASLSPGIGTPVPLARWEYMSLAAGIAGLAIISFYRRRPLREPAVVIIILSLSVAAHIFFIIATPVVIDEGAYIQDVLQTSARLFPFRDFLTKGPMYLVLLWLWGQIVPHAIIFWRLFSTVAWTGGAWCFWRLMRELDVPRGVRLAALFLFTLLPSSVALTTPLLLETASVSVSMLGLLLAARAGKSGRVSLAAWAGAVFAGSFFIRVTAAITALVAALLLILLGERKQRWRLLGSYIATGLVVFGCIFSAAILAFGLPKAAIMVNLEAILISQQRQAAVADGAAEPLIRSLAVESRFFWQTGPILLAGFFLAPLLALRRSRLLLAAMICAALYAVIAQLLFHLRDMGYLLPTHAPSAIWLITAFVAGLPVLTVVCGMLYGQKTVRASVGPRTWLPWIATGWLLLTVLAYAHWGRFRESYLTEFLPQLALLAAFGWYHADKLWRAISPRLLAASARAVITTGMCASIFQGYVLAARYPYTGTVDQGSLAEITRLIERHVPRGQDLFTAQPVATASAQQAIIFGYSHPGWYREARFHTISPELLHVMFRDDSAITTYLRDQARYVLTDSRTDEIYFDGYPERTAILRDRFEAVGSVDNPAAGDTYTLYQRK